MKLVLLWGRREHLTSPAGAPPPGHLSENDRLHETDLTWLALFSFMNEGGAIPNAAQAAQTLSQGDGGSFGGVEDLLAVFFRFVAEADFASNVVSLRAGACVARGGVLGDDGSAALYLEDPLDPRINWTDYLSEKGAVK